MWNATRGGQTINTRSPRENWQPTYNTGPNGPMQSQRRGAAQMWNNSRPATTGALEDDPEEDNSDLMAPGGKDEFARMALKTQELEKERVAYTNKHPASNGTWNSGGGPVKQPEPAAVQLEMSEKVWWYKDPKGNVQGPFASNDMRKWYRGNFFSEALPIRFRSDGKFLPLGQCYPDASIAFTVQPTPPAPKLAPPPGIPAPRGGMFDSFGVGVAGDTSAAAGTY